MIGWHFVVGWIIGDAVLLGFIALVVRAGIWKISMKKDGLRVEISQDHRKPKTCKVWMGDRLVFDGQDKSESITKKEHW